MDDKKEIVPVDTEQEIVNQILEEDDVDKTKKLVAMFNLHQQKKNVVRVTKFNELLDSVSDQMIQRFRSRPDEFSNADLLNYLQVVQQSIDRSNKYLNLVQETPSIQLQQNNQVNINVNNGLDRESKERIMATIKGILNKVNELPNNKENTIEIIEEESEDENKDE